MIGDLLTLPDRRNSIGPELIEFFQNEFGECWEEPMERFLKSFSGTTFVVPGPEFLSALRADVEIARMLKIDDGVDQRVKLMVKHGASYTHMQRVWQQVSGKMLETPAVPPGEYEIVKAAAATARRHPQLESDIFAMYALTSHQRVQASQLIAAMRAKRALDPEQVDVAATVNGRAGKEKAPAKAKPLLTHAQKRVIDHLKRARTDVTEDKLAKRFKRSQSRTIEALKDAGVVEVKGGVVKLVEGASV